MGLSFASKLLLSILLGFLILVPGTTPESTVTEFVDYVNSQNFAKAATLVQGGKPNADYSQIASFSRNFRFSLSGMKATVNGNRATVSVTTTLNDGQRSPQTQAEEVILVRVNGDWLIVAPDEALGRGMVSSLASMTKNPSMVFTNARNASKKSACISNLKQLALAAIMLTADYDDVYKLNPSRVKAALQPYSKNDRLWYCPESGPSVVAYSFNTKLIGKSSVDIKDPAKTVMMYEGSKGKLSFRHDGMAAVAFADGHVKFYKAADAAKLNWNP